MSRSALVVGLVCSLVSAPVSARVVAPAEGGDAETAAAMAHFEQGISLYEEGDYAAALFEFQQAYEARADYRLLFNIGVTALELKDYVSARDSLRQYLEQGGDEIAAERRAEVQQQLETLGKRIGSVTIVCNTHGATVSIDGEEVGTTPLDTPIELNLGAHQVTIEQYGHEPHRVEVDVAGGSSTTLDVSLAPIIDTMDPGPTQPVEPLLPPKAKPWRIATYVGLGLTAAAGVGLAVTGTLALQADDDLASELDEFPADAGGIADARDRRDRMATTSDAMIGVTAGLAAITIGLGITAAIVHKRDQKRWAHIDVGRGLVVRF